MPYLVDTVIPPELAERREALRKEHLAYLERTVASVLAAGAKLNEDGSVGNGSFFLLDFETEAEARNYISQDPYVEAGIVSAVSFTRVRKGFFDRRRAEAPK
jgi:uncharacterized protein